jgi:acetyltransferase-like isoleucine patch superfamily enzyme
VNIHDNISHPINWIERQNHFKQIISSGHPSKGIDLSEKAVVINNDAWIGFNATIMKGVTIGNRSIVGAYALVTKDVPDDAIVVGNPARIIGYVNKEK